MDTERLRAECKAMIHEALRQPGGFMTFQNETEAELWTQVFRLSISYQDKTPEECAARADESVKLYRQRAKDLEN